MSHRRVITDARQIISLKRRSASTSHPKHKSRNRDTTTSSSDKDRKHYRDEKPRNNREKTSSSDSYHHRKTSGSSHHHRSEATTSSSNEKGISSRLLRKLKEIIDIEHHHIAKKEVDSTGDVYTYIEWCPKYIRSDLDHHATGGRALLHHRCRECGSICLHLLGQYGSSNRKCLVCSSYEYGWSKHDVPEWYFHKHRCKHCR